MAPTDTKWRMDFELDAEDQNDQGWHRPVWRLRVTQTDVDGAPVVALEESEDEPMLLIPHAVAAVADLLVKRQQSLHEAKPDSDDDKG